MTDPNTPANAAHITIALCTYNGEAHLRAQLESYLDQHHTNWSLWVSDDGSSDATLEIIQQFAREHGAEHPVRVIEGPRKGVVSNYLSLLCHTDFPAGITALSDQDDIWLPEKLDHALSSLQITDTPCLYGAQNIHVDNDMTKIGSSNTGNATPHFANALVQNIVSGHSAVLSPTALELVRKAGVPEGIPYHDWWLYLLITAAGGQVVVDGRPTVLYRQHAANLMGAHNGWRATFERGMQVLGTTYGSWLDANAKALQACNALLTPDARNALDSFASRPRSPLMLARLGVRRQGRFSTACVYLAALLRRI
ncbi:MAG: glycosyltransferase [Sulfitobacter sp.]